VAKAKPRRRKHRGTQAGTVQRRGRTSRASAPARREPRKAPLDRPPSWRSAINRALIAGGVFFAVLALLFHRSLGESLSLAAFMLVLYVPMGYSMDSFRYRLMQRRKARQAERE
jgi:hypothetical protein